MAITAVPRLSYTLVAGRMAPPVGDVWQQTELVLPPRAPNEFINLFTGEQVRSNSSRTLLCREVFARFPVALLASR